jgi:hypothetical protein
MSGLVTGSLKTFAPALAGLSNLKVRWMNGIQFYLAKDVPVAPGHTLYADSPWALTSISQKQFWRDVPLSNFGGGKVGGLLSVDISEWEAPGILVRKPAMQCSAEEIKDEVWAELKVHLNVGGAHVIDDSNLLGWFLDPDIQFPNPLPYQYGAAIGQYGGIPEVSPRCLYAVTKLVPGIRLRKDQHGPCLHGVGQ